MIRSLLSFALIVITGCQPSIAPSPASEASRVESSSGGHLPTVQGASLPIQIFERHCFRPDAQYDTITALAEAMNLDPLPANLEPFMASQEGKGKGYVVEVERDGSEFKRILLLGASELNTCSVYAQGYQADEILEEAKLNYQLLSIMRDDVGLQVNEMFIPGGVSSRISEAHSKGVIGVMVAKPGSGAGDAITLSFTSPGTARKIFH